VGFSACVPAETRMFMPATMAASRSRAACAPMCPARPARRDRVPAARTRGCSPPIEELRATCNMHQPAPGSSGVQPQVQKAQVRRPRTLRRIAPGHQALPRAALTQHPPRNLPSDLWRCRLGCPLRELLRVGPGYWRPTARRPAMGMTLLRWSAGGTTSESAAHAPAPVGAAGVR
jgi:hypothetical protein